MISIERQKGFSLPEALIASALFSVTFAGSLTFSMALFERWDTLKLQQQGAQRLQIEQIKQKLEISENLRLFEDLKSNKIFLNGKDTTPYIKQVTIAVEVISSTKQLDASPNSISGFCIVTVPYSTKWEDISTLAPYSVATP